MLMVLELTPTYIPSSFLKTRYLGFQSLEKIGKIKGEDESKRERERGKEGILQWQIPWEHVPYHENLSKPFRKKMKDFIGWGHYAPPKNSVYALGFFCPICHSKIGRNDATIQDKKILPLLCFLSL